MTKMSNLNIDATAALVSQLAISFNKKKYIKQYQRIRATCVHCGSVVLRYKMERHMRAQKCVRARLSKIKI